MKLLMFLAGLVSLDCAAQTTIRGRVADKDGAPVAMANVFLVDTYDGATTQMDGTFAFTSAESGERVLAIRFVGFKEQQIAVTLNGKEVNIQAILREEISELKAVTITAGSFTASDESRRTVFRAVDIATTAGATADIAGALNTLPGTQKVGEQGRLFVRGGDGTEARTFIDGMVVLNPYSPSGPNAPSRGRFLPFMFKGTSFSTGGYSSEYGQALSSALVLDSRDKADMTRTDIGLMTVGADVAHTQAWERSSWAGKLQYTDIRPYFGLINQEIDWKEAPRSLEGSSVFRHKVGQSGMIKLFGNFNQSEFSLFSHDIDDDTQKTLVDRTNKYRYFNASYRDVLKGSWIVRGGASFTEQKDETEIGGGSFAETDRGLHAKSVVEGTIVNGLELKSGAEVLMHSDRVRQTGTLAAFNETILAVFTETDIYGGNNFVARIGGRSEYNSLQQSWRVDPRMSLAYKAGASGQVSLAYGQFTQSAGDQHVRIRRDIQSERAGHYIVNYQRIGDDRTFRAEAYYKKYSDLVKFADNESGITNAGSGYAKGFELFWRDSRSFKFVDYWVSYSWLDTKRNYLDFPVAATPMFASAHNFSAVGKYFVRSWKSQLGATYSFASGRPFNNPNSSQFNNGRTPDYHDLSFNWSYLPKPHLILYFSCTNLTGRDNVFGYAYSTRLNEDGVYNSRAIRQPAKRFLFIGVFITLSKEKSVNQLPTL